VTFAQHVFLRAVTEEDWMKFLLAVGLQGNWWPARVWVGLMSVTAIVLVIEWCALRAASRRYPQVQDSLLRVNLRPDLVLNGYRMRALIEGRPAASRP
jgi:hypothetical protein